MKVPIVYLKVVLSVVVVEVTVARLVDLKVPSSENVMAAVMVGQKVVFSMVQTTAQTTVAGE